LLVGIQEEDGLRFIGSAASGLTQKQLSALKQVLGQKTFNSPFINLRLYPGAIWVLPQIRIQVRFLEYTEQGMMRGPYILGFPEGL